jgi:hypothetical protein
LAYSLPVDVLPLARDVVVLCCEEERCPAG